MSAYKDAMKNLLEFVKDVGYGNIRIIDLPGSLSTRINTNIVSNNTTNTITVSDNTKPRKDRKEVKNILANNLPKPSIDQVKYWIGKRDELEDYVAQEAAIDKLFYGKFRTNDIFKIY